MVVYIVNENVEMKMNAIDESYEPVNLNILCFREEPERKE